jgi:hypothetical protein
MNIAQAEATVRSSKSSAQPAATATAVLLTLSSIDGLTRHQQQQQQHTTATATGTAVPQAHDTAVVKTFRGLLLTARTASSSRGSSAQARAHGAVTGSSSSQHCSKVSKQRYWQCGYCSIQARIISILACYTLTKYTVMYYTGSLNHTRDIHVKCATSYTSTSYTCTAHCLSTLL